MTVFQAFSDDETFLFFYMGTKVYKMDSNTAKTTENMRDFINDSMKQSIIFMRDELWSHTQTPHKDILMPSMNTVISRNVDAHVNVAGIEAISSYQLWYFCN